MAANYLKFKKKEPTRIQTNIEELFYNLGWKKTVDSKTQLELWKEVPPLLAVENARAAEVLSSKTYAHRINKSGELIIAVCSAALANELQFLKPRLIELYNQHAIQKKVSKLKGLIFELH